MSGTGVVGRDREMAAVAAFLDAVRSGPVGLLLEGEAGIGRSTVWSAGVAGAAERSYTVLSCRPAESEATLSFAALGDLLHGVLDQALPQLPPPQRRALEVALLLADPVGSQPEQRAVCVAFLAVIRQLSAAGPVVLAIDDLQWRPLAALPMWQRNWPSSPPRSPRPMGSLPGGEGGRAPAPTCSGRATRPGHGGAWRRWWRRCRPGGIGRKHC